jgi:hypothetical protein
MKLHMTRSIHRFGVAKINVTVTLFALVICVAPGRFVRQQGWPLVFRLRGHNANARSDATVGQRHKFPGMPQTWSVVTQRMRFSDPASWSTISWRITSKF